MGVSTRILFSFLLFGILFVFGIQGFLPKTKTIFLDEDDIVAKRTVYFKPGDDSEYYHLEDEEKSADVLARQGDGRQGQAPTTHNCGSVQPISDVWRSPMLIPGGIPSFYQKYTEAYGIPIISSNRVSDSALERACYVTRFLLADNRDIRNAFYKRAGRVAVIGHDEDTLDIPEHEVPSYWTMKKLRGLGATVSHPVSSAGEENLLCFKNNDKYPNEDRLLHELAHGIHNLGAKYALNGWHLRLEKHFNTIKGSNLWKETHARSTVYEYFAEGVQSYFNDNGFSDPPNGFDGTINTNKKLKSYDPKLFELIQEVFPCNNDYINRCNSNRATEAAEGLRMDCPRVCYNCKDDNPQCPAWAARGECASNPLYMLEKCKKSCTGDKGQVFGNPNCLDMHFQCQRWAAKGECTKNPVYMLKVCKKSCNNCR